VRVASYWGTNGGGKGFKLASEQEFQAKKCLKRGICSSTVAMTPQMGPAGMPIFGSPGIEIYLVIPKDHLKGMKDFLPSICSHIRLIGLIR